MERIEPEFIERMEARVARGASLLIGIGVLGEVVSARLSAVAAPRQLAPVTTVLATAAGWRQGAASLPAAEQDETWDDPHVWWEEHGDAGTDAIEAAIRAHPRTADGDIELDIILVADWQNAVGRALWLPVLDAARRAHLPFSERCFTLIFATDSTAFRRMSAEESRAMRQSVEALARELRRDAEPHGEAMRIGWCYLCDTLGVDTRALVGAPGQHARERELQREHIAEFIALLLGGLRTESSYATHSLAGLRQLFRTAGGARVSAFGAGTFRLPLAEIAALAEAELAHRLAERLHGTEGYTERARARTARKEWESLSELSRGSVRHFLEQGGGEGELDFPLEPPTLENAPDHELLALLDTWDAFLWGRWNLPDAPHSIVAARVARMTSESTSVLHDTVGRVLDGELNGARVADYTLREIEKTVMALRATVERRAARLPWLSALLAAPEAARADERPPLATLRAKAERALARRLNRRAVWMRAAIAAAVLFLFAWAAYQAIQRASGVSGLLTRALGVTSEGVLAAAGLVDALVILLLCAGTTLFVAALQIGWSERRIQLSLHAYQEGIAAKYRALLAALVESGIEHLYDAVQAEIAALRAVVAARRAAWDDVREQLSAALERPATAALATEELWASPATLREMLPDADEEAEHRLAQTCLERHGFSPEGVEATVASLARVARAELARWRRSLEWRRARGKDGENAPTQAQVVAGLRARVVAAVPLEREGRAPVTHLSAQMASPNGSGSRGQLAESFIGLPVGEQDEIKISARVGEHVSRWCAPWQVARVVTLHGLELTELAIWRALPRVPDEQEQEPLTEREDHEPRDRAREEENDDVEYSLDSDPVGHGSGGTDRDHALERAQARRGGADAEREPGRADEPGVTAGAPCGGGTAVAPIA